MVARTNHIDTVAMPEWGTAPDGRRAKIAHDERLPALFSDWQADACAHAAQVLVEHKDSLGRKLFFRHCEHCGLKLSSAIAHEKAGNPSDYTPADMAAAAEGYVADRQGRLDKISSQAAQRCQEANRASYDDYLRSDAWRRKTALILKRAGGTCEGCLSRPATQVHHLTYEHVGQEFAFELIAVCGHCHARIHGAAA